MKRHNIKLTRRKLVAYAKTRQSTWSNMDGFLFYPEGSDAREACALAIALESIGENFPDVPACLKAGQHISEILPALRSHLAWYIAE
jgi:hypothetical protein